MNLFVETFTLLELVKFRRIPRVICSNCWWVMPNYTEPTVVDLRQQYLSTPTHAYDLDSGETWILFETWLL